MNPWFGAIGGGGAGLLVSLAIWPLWGSDKLLPKRDPKNPEAEGRGCGSSFLGSLGSCQPGLICRPSAGFAALGGDTCVTSETQAKIEAYETRETLGRLVLISAGVYLGYRLSK